ncbi:MAG: HTH domain-containing protein [Muribaculaceae bacterium]|nr:HTH domain-containing protein [Muribaculaceae bacterium]
MRVEGNFFDLLDAGLAFCFKHLNLSGKITNRSLQREERLEIPYKALREAIINSLCHRQWEKYNLLNSIAIYDDRVEIGNPGIFPSQITPENIKEPHDSYPYNVKMAEALYRSMWLENWGSGAKRIIEACQEQGVEEPTWRWDGGFVYVTFKRPSYKQVSDFTQLPTKQEDGSLNHRLGTDQVPPNLAPSTTESTTEDSKSTTEGTIETLMSSIEFTNGNTEHKILELLKLDGSLTIDQLYPLLKMSRKGVQKAIERLKDKGILYREGSTKGGRWIVKRKS